MKLGMVGSRSFTDVERAKIVLEKYLRQYGDSLIVVSGGASGADRIAKDLALKNGIKYIEFPPAHQIHNEHCILPEECYNKPYKVGNFFERNGQIAEYSDHIVAFVVEGIQNKGTMDTVEKAKRLGKHVLIFSQIAFDPPQST